MATKSKKMDFLDSNYPKDKPDAKATSVRLVKTVKITFTNYLEDVETEVNTEILNLARKGCKIISVHPMQVGFNPMYVLYNIIYEPSQNFFDELLKDDNAE